MRKFLSLIAAMLLCLSIKAQGLVITEAADFSFSANGKEMTLFEVLDNGKHALLYFFNYKSETSEENAPLMNEVYNSLGKNKKDVYMIGLDPSNESVLLENWAVLTEVEYPLVAKDKAYYISQTYGGTWGVMMPALILIAPDHDIILEEIWPIESAEQVVEIINNNLVEGVEPENPLGIPQNLVATPGTTTMKLEWDAVENATSYYIYEGTKFIGETTNTKYTVDGLTAETEYCFYVSAVNDLEESDTAEVCAETNEAGQPQVPMAPEIYVWVENPFTVVIEWGAVEGAEYYNVYHEGNYVGPVTEGTEVGIDVWDGRTYCFTVTAVNSYGESEHSNEECATTPSVSDPDDEDPEEPEPEEPVDTEEPEDGNIEVVPKAFSIYPNPASTDIKITSEMSGQAEINIFDMTGRCVKNFRVSDISDATINVSDINKGVYFININGKVEKLTIK